jgi:hypothetical protein
LLDILTMHLPINVKSPNNISKWQMGFNLAFKGLKCVGDTVRIHLAKASNQLWATVNTEINFGMNGRCGVNGQLSKHYNIKDYG